MKLPKGGFTLFEILLVVVLVGLTVFPLVFYARQANQSQALKTSVAILVDSLQEAKNSSRDARNQSSWGVVSISDKSYQLVYGNKDKFTVSKTVDLENGSTFKNKFTVWFTIGESNLVGDKKIEISNDFKVSYQININVSGVIEASKL